MSSFRMPLALPMLLLCALAACTATPPTEAQPPGPGLAGDRATTAVPPGASGKLSPQMVDKVSPVPAFMGHGEHFSIKIHSQGERTADGFGHRVHLIRGSGSYEAEGTLFYRGTPGPSRGTPILLDGTLNTTKGKRAIRVEIVTEPCTDDADVVHPQRVKIAMHGETALNGCGELAVY